MINRRWVDENQCDENFQRVGDTSAKSPPEGLMLTLLRNRTEVFGDWGVIVSKHGGKGRTVLEWKSGARSCRAFEGRLRI